MTTCRTCKYATVVDGNADYIECSCPAPWACWDEYKDHVLADEEHNCACWTERNTEDAGQAHA